MYNELNFTFYERKSLWNVPLDYPGYSLTSLGSNQRPRRVQNETEGQEETSTPFTVLVRGNTPDTPSVPSILHVDGT